MIYVLGGLVALDVVCMVVASGWIRGWMKATRAMFRVLEDRLERLERKGP